MNRTSKTAGYLLTITGGLLWAIGGSFGQQVFQLNQATSNWLVPIRLFIAGAMILAVAYGKNRGQIMDVWRNKKDVRDLLLFTLLGAGASQYTYYTCIQYSNAAFATVISYMFPAIILIYQVIRQRRAPRGYELAAVILVTVGAITCTTQWNLDAMKVAPIAVVVGLFSAAASAYNTVKPQRLLKKYSLLSIIGWSMLLSGAVYALICRPWRTQVLVNGRLIWMMAVVIIGGTIFAFCCFQAGVRIVGSLAGSVLASVEPVGAVLIAVIFLKVPLTGMDIFGFFLILITIPLIALGQRREEAMESAIETVTPSSHEIS